MTPSMASLTSQRVARLLRHHLQREFSELSKVPLLTRHVVNACGVYALYYTGSDPLYAVLKNSLCSEIPIYAGVTTGSLDKRLNDHQTSLTRAAFDTHAFTCRIFPTTADLAKSAEDMLINTYGPIWNSALPGFGLHDPGKGRSAGKVSQWDHVHPGRPWVPQSLDYSNKARLESLLTQALTARYQSLYGPNVPENPSPC